MYPEINIKRLVALAREKKHWKVDGDWNCNAF